MENKQTNSAKRLLSILREASNITEDITLKEVWAKVFSYSSNSIFDIYRGLTKLNSLVDEVENCIKRTDRIDHKLHLKPFGTIRNLIKVTNLDVKWPTLRNKLSPELFTSLEFTDDVLSREWSDELIDQSELNDLLDEINTLLNDVLESSLDEMLKRVLVDNLEKIRRVIIDYKISGNSALYLTFEETMGTIILNQDQFSNEDEEVSRFKDIYRKFLIVISRTSYGIIVANALVSLTKHISPETVERLHQIFKSLPPGHS